MADFCMRFRPVLFHKQALKINFILYNIMPQNSFLVCWVSNVVPISKASVHQRKPSI